MPKKPNPNIVQRWPDEDKKMLEELSRQLVRSQAATLRILVRGAWGALRDRETKNKANTKAEVQQ